MAADRGKGIVMLSAFIVVEHLHLGQFGFLGGIVAATIFAHAFISAILEIAAAYCNIFRFQSK